MSQPKLADRLSGVELLKIIGIFLIVVNHVTQTLGEYNSFVDYQDYIFHFGSATSDLQVLIITLLRQTGAVGNNIFFICSAWFLLDLKGTERKRAFFLLSTVWAVSVFMLSLYWFIDPSCMTKDDIIMQFFPTCFANNWYMTCYILFLFIYPWLNKLIEGLEQRQLLRIVLFSSLLWIVVQYFQSGWFYATYLTCWISIYFLMAYLKIYCRRLMTSAWFGLALFIIGTAGAIGQVVITNYVGLHFGIYADWILRWNSNSCPFYIMLAIGALILALQSTFRNRLVNYLSGLSMFVYLFHENFLFRTYTRPAIWHYLYVTYGYEHVLGLDLCFAAALFLASVVVSCVYKETVQRLVTVISDRIYLLISKIYGGVEKVILKIH